MAKRSKNKAADLVIALITILTAILAFIGMACNFIEGKYSVIGYSETTKWNLSKWFEVIDEAKDMNNIANWQVACALLIVTAVLLSVMLVLLLLKLFIKNRALKWSVFTLGIAVAICAVMFMVLTILGCSNLSNSVNQLSSVEYRASIGVYLLAIGATVSGISATIMAVRK